MNKLMLASLAALALVQAPAAFARPITATDLATMRRLAVALGSPDGNWAVYQLQRDRPRRQSPPQRPLAARSAPRRRGAGAHRLDARA